MFLKSLINSGRRQLIKKQFSYNFYFRLYNNVSNRSIAINSTTSSNYISNFNLISKKPLQSLCGITSLLSTSYTLNQRLSSIHYQEKNYFSTMASNPSNNMYGPSHLLSEEAKKHGFCVIDTPNTPATQFLYDAGIFSSASLTPETFSFFAPEIIDDFDNKIDSTKQKTTALQQVLNIDEHCIIKTLLFHDPRTKQPMCILQHGDRLVNTKPVAKAFGCKTILSLSPDAANEISGYIVGGTSPFGLKTKMPIFIQQSILDLDEIIINGGGLHNLIVMKPQLIEKALKSQGFDVHYVDCEKLRKSLVTDPNP